MSSPQPSPQRTKVVGRIADQLVGVAREHPTRVAVDSITAGGKSTFAAELAAAVRERGRAAAHLTTDDFHHRAEHRHRDHDRARGYYRDAYDLSSFRRMVLDPLGPGGNRQYRERLHDLDTDEILDLPPVAAALDSIVVVDGSFLQSAPLRGGWDEIVWLDVSYAEAVLRGVARDSALFGGPDAAREAFAQRYHAACRLYVEEVEPHLHATAVVDNNDVTRPILQRIGGDHEALATLFASGDLREPQVQLASFGRRIDGEPDSVGDLVGSTLSVTTTELAATDMYEPEEYRREFTHLTSGGTAWAYVKR